MIGIIRISENATEKMNLTLKLIFVCLVWLQNVQGSQFLSTSGYLLFTLDYYIYTNGHKSLSTLFVEFPYIKAGFRIRHF